MNIREREIRDLDMISDDVIKKYYLDLCNVIHMHLIYVDNARII